MGEQRKRHLRAAVLLSLLVLAWLLWSGFFKTLLLSLGAFSCLLCLYLAKRIGFLDSVTGMHLLPRLPAYWLKLIVEIVTSSLHVAKVILDPRLPIAPTVIDLEAEPKGEIGQVILGNAITLSPGTVTIDVYKGRLKVHCLTKQTADDLLSGAANRKAAALTSD